MITNMKTVGILVLWFASIITLAVLVSCGSTHHCDAYSQEKHSINTKNLSK